jgi:RHS repeat-associated protein
MLSMPRFRATGFAIFCTSVRNVVRASDGAVVQAITYDAWGKVTSDTNPGFQPFGFAGGVYDSATGLTHLGAREFDAAAGRWTSKDATRFAGGLNLYGYCVDDPVNYVDPSGDAPQWLHDINDAGYLYDAQNFSAGVVSGLTFGFSDVAFGAVGIDNCTKSRAYRAGDIGSQVAGALSGVGEVVALRRARATYVAAVRAIPGQARALAPAIGSENAARWAVASRNVAKADARDGLGMAGKGFEWRNEARYGNALGPTPDYLVGKYGSWEGVANASGRTSPFWDFLGGTR